MRFSPVMERENKLEKWEEEVEEGKEEDEDEEGKEEEEEEEEEEVIVISDDETYRLLKDSDSENDDELLLDLDHDCDDLLEDEDLNAEPEPSVVKPIPNIKPDEVPTKKKIFVPVVWENTAVQGNKVKDDLKKTVSSANSSLNVSNQCEAEQSKDNVEDCSDQGGGFPRVGLRDLKRKEIGEFSRTKSSLNHNRQVWRPYPKQFSPRQFGRGQFNPRPFGRGFQRCSLLSRRGEAGNQAQFGGYVNPWKNHVKTFTRASIQPDQARFLEHEFKPDSQLSSWNQLNNNVGGSKFQQGLRTNLGSNSATKEQINNISLEENLNTEDEKFRTLKNPILNSDFQALGLPVTSELSEVHGSPKYCLDEQDPGNYSNTEDAATDDEIMLIHETRAPSNPQILSEPGDMNLTSNLADSEPGDLNLTSNLADPSFILPRFNIGVPIPIGTRIAIHYRFSQLQPLKGKSGSCARCNSFADFCKPCFEEQI